MLHSSLASLAFLLTEMDSPFVVPVAGCLMIFGIVAASMWSNVRQRELQSTERLAAIAKGVPVPPTPGELAILHGRPSVDLARRRGNVRRGGIVCVGIGVGLALFFIALAAVLQDRRILSGAAVALIPLGIGVALLIDARMQTREMEEASQRPLTPTRDLTM